MDQLSPQFMETLGDQIVPTSSYWVMQVSVIYFIHLLKIMNYRLKQEILIHVVLIEIMQKINCVL